MHLPRLNIQILRRVKGERGILVLELGKFWEIRFTRSFQEDAGFYEHHSKESKGFTKQIKQGGVIPHWYGFAYHDFDTDTASYMPIPINLLYSGYRWLKYYVLMRISIEW